MQVCNPQKQNDTGRSYVAYTLRVRKIKDGVESSTFRRFSDFLWIHDTLVNKYPSCVVPPMPEKSLSLYHLFFSSQITKHSSFCHLLVGSSCMPDTHTTAGNFEPALMMFRSRELTRFVQRVAAHPTLSADDDFEFFLMAPWDDFTAKRSASPVKESVVGSMFSSLMNAFGGKVEDTDDWFIKITAELGERKTLLQGLQESAAGIVSGWRELTQLYNVQSQQLQALSKFFGDAEASRCGEDAHAMEANVAVLDEFATHVEHSYLDNISDYIREITAIETVLARRLELLKEYKSLSKTAEKKGAEALAKRDEALSKFDAFSATAREDIQRVLQTRRGELERIVLGVAQMHRDAFTRTGSDWTSAINSSGASSDASATTTTTTTTASLGNAESAGPFSSAVFDGVPSSPYATGDD